MSSHSVSALALILAITVTPLPTWAQTAPATLPGNVAIGKALAMQWCAACHLIAPATPGVIASADIPTFPAIAKTLPTDADVLAAFIANPHPPMPSLALSRQNIRDLLAYVSTLR